MIVLTQCDDDTHVTSSRQFAGLLELGIALYFQAPAVLIIVAVILLVATVSDNLIYFESMDVVFYMA